MAAKPKKRKPKTHPSVRVLKLWQQLNLDSYDATTLGSTSPSYYLGNRLDRAFMAGWDAAERHYARKRKAKS